MAGVQPDAPPPPPPLRYVLFHKPRGVLTAKQRDATNLALPTVTEVLITGGLAEAAELSPVGRLDAESEGLLLLTDDGWLNHCMTQPAFGCSKTYLAVARGHGQPGRRRRVRTGWCQKRVAM
jgi:23S rRNA pseudouridine2457 synthase